MANALSAFTGLVCAGLAAEAAAQAIIPDFSSGESVGHYEGDTVVIDTLGLNDRTTIDNFRTPHTDKLHVVERWRLVDGGKQLEVLIRIDDPDTFYQTWSAIQRYRPIQQTLPEEVCAENNTHAEYHIPSAGNADF
jgi:hypothetical protein